ncbi:Uncharacterised protein [Yersinia pekkanenii]|uniref:Uncharacterized protein n=1 Tax=Yersinia pekkanenii TaxID=1288385 RepID=A0A0T9R2I7_9GAMM|nr:Uncharacterised protein [Yersinia pekkanenii]CRY69040.1 Uncharacterised protein [Yersinia pekkanenii]
MATSQIACDLHSFAIRAVADQRGIVKHSAAIHANPGTCGRDAIDAAIVKHAIHDLDTNAAGRSPIHYTATQRAINLYTNTGARRSTVQFRLALVGEWTGDI